MIGVRESYVNLSSNTEDKLQVWQDSKVLTKKTKISKYNCSGLQIYRDNFERAYIEATEAFYRVQAPDHLKENGVQASEIAQRWVIQKSLHTQHAGMKYDGQKEI